MTNKELFGRNSASNRASEASEAVERANLIASRKSEEFSKVDPISLDQHDKFTLGLIGYHELLKKRGVDTTDADRNTRTLSARRTQATISFLESLPEVGQTLQRVMQPDTSYQTAGD